MFHRPSLIVALWLALSVPVFAQTVTNTTPGASDLGVVTRNIPSGTQAVSGPLTDTQLRATPVPVDGSGSTQPISGTVTVTDGSGALTVDGTVNAAQSGTWNVNNISGTVTLPTGASTLSEQQTQTTSLQLIDDIVHATNGALGKAAAIGGQLDDTGTTAATENNVAPIRITAQRAAHVNLRKDDGTEVNYLSTVDHDAAASTVQPLLTGCYSSAAAPTDVSADTDATREWCLRNGARAIQPTFAGVLATTGNGASGTGVQRVTIANDSTGIVALTTGSAQIGHLEANQSSNVAQINGVTPLMGNGASGTGALRVSIANDSTGIVGTVPLTAGGLSTFRRVSTADTNIANVKGSAGQLYAVQASNVNAAARYLHVYNASGSPTCNTGIINTWVIPGNTAGGGTNIMFPNGIAFGTGIGICITTAVDGTGSVGANDIVVNLQYK